MNSKWWVVSSEIGTQDMKGEVNDGDDIPNDCSKPCPKRPRLSEIEKKTPTKSIVLRPSCKDIKQPFK